MNTYPADEQRISDVERGRSCGAVVPFPPGGSLAAGDTVLFALSQSRAGRPPCYVMGGDSVLVLLTGVTDLGANDPITGQGSNNASKCAKIYLDAIVSQGASPFDEAWMQATFDRYWAYAQYVTGWTNALLRPPPPHVLNIMGAAQSLPPLARRIANGFDEPLDLFPWFAVPEEADKYLKSLTA